MSLFFPLPPSLIPSLRYWPASGVSSPRLLFALSLFYIIPFEAALFPLGSVFTASYLPLCLSSCFFPCSHFLLVSSEFLLKSFPFPLSASPWDQEQILWDFQCAQPHENRKCQRAHGCNNHILIRRIYNRMGKILLWLQGLQRTI